MLTETKQLNEINLDAVLAMQEQLKLLAEQNAQLQAQVASKTLGQKKKYKLLIKVNEKGGIFIQDTSVKAFSDRTQKEYVPSINIHAYQLEAFKSILSDSKTCAKVIDVINTGKEYRA